MTNHKYRDLLEEMGVPAMIWSEKENKIRLKRIVSVLAAHGIIDGARIPKFD